MKLCAIQPEYPYTPDRADAAVEYLVDALGRCDESCDLILLPEYSNAPTVFPKGECIPYAKNHTDRLIRATVDAARRCRAIVAVNYVAEIGGSFRNTTRVFDSRGNVAGDYYKQHLPVSETAVKMMDDAYTFGYLPPEIVEADGIRLGFLTCYDCYFNEYIAHIAARKPDIVLVSSHQRSERADILEMQVKNIAFNTNAFVLRASVAMGEGRDGGCSMVAGPDGRILAGFGQQIGMLSCEIGDPHRKYMRSNSFGGAMIPNDRFVEQGRTPWSYRACGSAVIPGDDKLPYPRVCAHRGFSAIAPENSLPAFGAAIALGATEIELDVWETKDGVPVVSHDPSVERTSNGTGSIREMTFAELRKLDFGARHAEAFAGLRIPALDEVLGQFPRQVIVNLHVKSSGTEHFSRETIRKLDAAVRRYDCLGHVYVTGRADVMEALLEAAPELIRCMGAGDDPMNVVKNAIRYKCRKLQFMKPHFTREMIDEAHAHGIRCNMFWSDIPAEAAEMVGMGIDTVLTNNYLQIARAVRNKVNKSDD